MFMDSFYSIIHSNWLIAFDLLYSGTLGHWDGARDAAVNPKTMWLTMIMVFAALIEMNEKQFGIHHAKAQVIDWIESICMCGDNSARRVIYYTVLLVVFGVHMHMQKWQVQSNVYARALFARAHAHALHSFARLCAHHSQLNSVSSNDNRQQQQERSLTSFNFQCDLFSFIYFAV